MEKGYNDKERDSAISKMALNTLYIKNKSNFVIKAKKGPSKDLSNTMFDKCIF